MKKILDGFDLSGRVAIVTNGGSLLRAEFCCTLADPLGYRCGQSGEDPLIDLN